MIITKLELEELLYKTLPNVLNPKFESSCRICREDVTIRNIGGYEMYDDGVDIHSTVCQKKHCQEVCDNFRTVEEVRKMDCGQEEKHWEVEEKELLDASSSNNSMMVCSPHYPAIENQHHKEVLLVKNEVSDLKKEWFFSIKKG